MKSKLCLLYPNHSTVKTPVAVRMIHKTLFAFHKKSPEIEVTLLRSWLHPTICCFDAQCFFVFVFIPKHVGLKTDIFH
jgi:hypothetical protein